MRSFKSYMALTMLAMLILAQCAPRPRVYFKPQTGFRPYKNLAILPFDNLSGKEDAGKQVANMFLVELLKKSFFRIVEPGEVDRVLREERIRSSDNIDMKNARLLNEKLGADLLLIGAVNEYDYMIIEGRQIPKVGFTVRLLDASNGEIVWAATYSRKGDDTELIFGWGLVSSLSDLAQKSVRDVLKSLKAHS